MAKILIVDDDRDFLESLTMVLENAGYSYIATADSKTVEKKVRSYRPNLVILDVFLNDDNGKNIARDLKKTFDTRHIPIILISGSSNIHQYFLQCSVDAYLRKPFASQELIETISGLIIKRQKLDYQSSLTV